MRYAKRLTERMVVLGIFVVGRNDPAGKGTSRSRLGEMTQPGDDGADANDNDGNDAAGACSFAPDG